MIKISKHTKLDPNEIINIASRYFGKKGEGLIENERSTCIPCFIKFEGGGGYVSISIYDDESQRKVDVEAREYEYLAKEFLYKL
ncbi:hypothetical protein [uncultured Desulfosarcina sp.]|uniref:hypothetical protein n=1 Tax=uncultured Desulfosarcina sp. TaxID=218289 RepID=UPI0029C7C537|nr:hypothetical protein [uncultured Desulfosarcina sp.]